MIEAKVYYEKYKTIKKFLNFSLSLSLYINNYHYK